MNKLSTERRAAILGQLCEGMSLRGTARITGVGRETVNRLLLNAGQAVSAYQDAAFRNLDVKRVEADEIWAFCGSKAKNVPEDKRDDPNYGDVWTWVALDADTKLVPSWRD